MADQSNLPPGVRASDIPGNREEDVRLERAMDELYEIIANFIDEWGDDAWHSVLADIATNFPPVEE